MSENTKTYIAMVIGCLFIVVYVKYLHEPLINASLKALGIN